MWQLLALTDESIAAYVTLTVTSILTIGLALYLGRRVEGKDDTKAKRDEAQKETQAKVDAAVEIAEIKGDVKAILEKQESFCETQEEFNEKFDKHVEKDEQHFETLHGRLDTMALGIQNKIAHVKDGGS